MAGFKSANGYEFEPSEVIDGIDIEARTSASSGFARSLHYESLRGLWRYFADPEGALANRSVRLWEEPVVYTFDDRGVRWGLALKRGERVTEEDITALRELYEWLDGAPISGIRTHQPTALAKAMLSVDNSVEQIEAIWADEAQRTLWIERAKIALVYAGLHFQ